MTTDPKIFAIVLNYNGLDCLISCLDSLYACSYKNLEIVVVDNASTDGSLEAAKAKFPRFHFIRNSQNIGFAAGNNVAIRFALEKMADYVFLLNNDAKVENDTIENLLEEGELRKDAGMLSPIIMDGYGLKTWFSGGKIRWMKMKTEHVTGVLSKEPYETDYVSGCAVLIKKSVFKEIGLFDEDFFLYYEDADLSFRAKKAGFDLIIIPKATAYHLEKSASENKSKLYWLVISGLIFFTKNSSGLLRTWVTAYILARKIRLFLKKAFARNDPDFKQIVQAFKDYGNFSRNR